MREREPSDDRAYGIVVAKDVMVTMRDGIRLATDVYRPARDGELVRGPLSDDRLHHAVRQDRAALHRDRRLLRPARLRRRASRTCATGTAREGTKEYFHSATPHTGEDGYDTIEWIAAQPWSNGRTGMVGSSYAGDHADPHGAREPAAPDRDLARRRADEHVPAPDARGRRDAAAHVLGALHPRGRRAGRAGRPGASRRRSGTTCATCGS